MTFVTNSLKQSIPFAIKAIPEIKIESLSFSEQTYECIHTLHKSGFNIVAVISDNHSTNVPVFNILIKMFLPKSPRENSHPLNSPLENSHPENSAPENSHLEYSHPFH